MTKRRRHRVWSAGFVLGLGFAAACDEADDTVPGNKVVVDAGKDGTSGASGSGNGGSGGSGTAGTGTAGGAGGTAGTGTAGAGGSGTAGSMAAGGAGGAGGGGGPSDCFTDPTTHFEIINACSDADKVTKTPALTGLLPDGGLPAL